MLKTQRAVVLLGAVVLGALAPAVLPAGAGPAASANPAVAVAHDQPVAAGQPAGLGQPPMERPKRLAGHLTDSSDVLGERTGEAERALEDLRRETGLQLFVVFVHTFSGQAAQSWVEATASRSDLGDRDALLAVATRDRAYAYSFAQDYPLTDAQLAEVAQVAIEPPLSENDWAGAVVGAADGYRAALAGQPIPEPVVTPGPSDERTMGELLRGLAWVVVPLLLLVGAVMVIWWWLAARRRRTARAARELDQARTEQVAARANALLVELDNELRASEQELALAIGHYGHEATAAFTAALQSARQEVTEAFRLRISLDEDTVDEAAKRQRLMEIISRCEEADRRLDAEAEAFDRLRQMESRVEQLLAELLARRVAVERRAEPAAATLEQLRSQYAPEVLAAVVDNPAAARERLGFAAESLAQAGEAIGRDIRPRAVLAVRAAEEALGQAETLIEAVEKAGPDLETTSRAVDALLAELDEEIQQGRAILSGASPSTATGTAAAVGAAAGTTAAGVADNTALVAAVDQAVRTVAEVCTELGRPVTDPPAALRKLEAADASLDTALAVSVETEKRIAHAQALLSSALGVAAAEIQAANGYVSARRGAVGQHARTLLAEAARQQGRAQGLAVADPVTALAAAQEAGRLASAASQSARADVHAWQPAGHHRGGYAPGQSGGEAFRGAMIGGILSGGSGRSSRRHSQGGSWGGGFGGSSSRTRCTGGSSGRRGSGTTRRSGGGRRSGSTRRSGGGRF